MTSKPGGRMPMMACGRPSTSTSRPTIGSPPNADSHNSCERIATGGPPTPGCVDIASVSPGAKSRPCTGRTPSVASRWSSTSAQRARSGRSPANTLTAPAQAPEPPPATPSPTAPRAPTSANDRFILRYSRYSSVESLCPLSGPTG